MKKFMRQKSGNSPTAEINLDLGTALRRRHVSAGGFQFRIEPLALFRTDRTSCVALDLVMAESGDRIDSRPLWVDGRTSRIGPYAVRTKICSHNC